MIKLNRLLDRLYDIVESGFPVDTDILWDEINIELEHLKNKLEQYETVLNVLKKKEDTLFKQLTAEFNDLEQLNTLMGERTGVEFAIDLLKEITDETN